MQFSGIFVSCQFLIHLRESSHARALRVEIAPEAIHFINSMVCSSKMKLLCNINVQ